eukprot:4296536-Pleurochrysis_carterae.AAC.2
MTKRGVARHAALAKGGQLIAAIRLPSELKTTPSRASSSLFLSSVGPELHASQRTRRWATTLRRRWTHARLTGGSGKEQAPRTPIGR